MKWQKRAFDIFWTVSGLWVLAPLFLLIALWIKLDDGGPIFFKQERVGQRGKIFHLWKFRSMVLNAEKMGRPLTVGGDPRITRAGYWLRKFKLDELPQLFNVLKGEMSLVGPRPEVPHYVAFYTPEQLAVLELVPGITDPASIKYRHESLLLAQAKEPEQFYITTVMPDKIQINLEYAARATLWSDFQIILQTLWAAFDKT
jgi:lipopolysaccharide/colanic/teichoic acid biosynthesis glycosyltransferase